MENKKLPYNPTIAPQVRRIESGVSKSYLYTHVHRSTVRNSQMVGATQVSIHTAGDIQDVVCNVHAVKCPSASQRKEILAQATAWMNVEDVMLSEMSRPQKDIYCVIPVVCGA